MSKSMNGTGLVCFLLIVLADLSLSRVFNQGDLENLLSLSSNALALIKRQALLHPDTGLNITQFKQSKVKVRQGPINLVELIDNTNNDRAVVKFTCHQEIRMKVVYTTVIIFVVGNLKTSHNNIEKKIWEVVWEYLGVFNVTVLHPDCDLNISQFLAKYDYPLESHDVTTEDGYVLTVHRVPYGRNGLGDAVRPAVVFAHCLACSSMDWIWQGPNASLPLLLTDLGYDVWLANMRGNSHALRHQTLTTKNASFWNYSFHEKGIYDMAATIDYILTTTKQEKLTYVGHSQGTTAGLALISSKPEYNDKMNLFAMLSPVIYCSHMTSPVVKLLVDSKSILQVVFGLFNIHSVPPSRAINILAQTVCSENSSLQGFCIFLIDLFAGFDADQVDKSTLSVYVSNTPDGVGFKEVDHLLQEVQSGQFRQYDYGNSLSNLAHYGTSEPPNYDLTKVTAPLAVYYAKNDFLAAVVDVEKFISELNVQLVDNYLVEYEYFNHLDFTTAKNIKTLLYDRIIKVIQEASPVS